MDPLLAPRAQLTGRNVEAALAIYRRNRDGACQRALTLSFPATAQLLAPGNLHRMAWAYCTTRSPTGSLECLGDGLLHWLVAQPQWPDMVSDHPYLLSLLRYDWAFHCAYYAPPRPLPNPSDCDAWLSHPEGPPPWRLHPELGLVCSGFEVSTLHAQLLEQGSCWLRYNTPGPHRLYAVWPEPEAVGRAILTREELGLLAWLQSPGKKTPRGLEGLAGAWSRGWLVAR